MTLSNNTTPRPALRAVPNAKHGAALPRDAASPAPALFRLLSESTVMRGALAACGLPLALADARALGHPLTYANPAFEAFFGYDPGQAQGQPLEALIPGEQEARRLCVQAPARGLTAARRTNGTLVTVEFTVGPVHSAEQLTHWVFAFNDVTEVLALRAELSNLRSKTGAAP